MRALRLFVLLAACLCGAAHADEALWKLLQGGGQVVLIRHAQTTPGVGDPAGMRLEDCASQRNLDDEGRRQAQALGRAWRERKVPIAAIESSPWCRCIETGRIAFGREAAVNTALGNLFSRPEKEHEQVQRLKAIASRKPVGGNLVMLTHGSTVGSFVGIAPRTAEMVILTPTGAGYRVAGRLYVE